MKASLRKSTTSPEVNWVTGNCFRMVRIVLKITFLKLRYPGQRPESPSLSYYGSWSREFRNWKKEASEGKYNLVFTSSEALFGSHRSTTPTLKNEIEAVFIDEVHCIVKEASILFIFTLLESYQIYTTFRSAAFLLSKVRFCCLRRLSRWYFTPMYVYGLK